VADDSPTIRRVVELCFGDSGCHVESVASGREALERLDELNPDIVLVDVVMPGPSGYEICRRIKGSDRPVPVLLLAGTFEPFDHELARACGADGCLMKPFDSRTLLDRVASLLAGREAVTASPVEPVAAVPAPPPPVVAGEAAIAPSPPSTESEPLPAGLSEAELAAIARAVVERLTVEVVREIAREVVPRAAEAAVRQRIRELEAEDPS
jgi:CheY-like chemotaxis protein